MKNITFYVTFFPFIIINIITICIYIIRQKIFFGYFSLACDTNNIYILHNCVFVCTQLLHAGSVSNTIDIKSLKRYLYYYYVRLKSSYFFVLLRNILSFATEKAFTSTNIGVQYYLEKKLQIRY